MTITYLIAFLTAVSLSVIFTPLVIRFAGVIGATDVPDGRKVHTTIMPRIGGLAIFLSFALTAGILLGIFPDLRDFYEGSLVSPAILAFCFTALFLLGFVDDLKSLRPEIKFGVQLVLATLVYLAGISISSMTMPLSGANLELGIIDYPLTVIWIVGITNAINLIDGLDGLATGIGIIASVTVVIVCLATNQIITGLLALMLAGSLLGFLRYNFNPARIFLGDSGSLSIGFALAILSIQSAAKLTTGFALIFPMLILILPITDTLVSMSRRLLGTFLKRTSPEPAPMTLGGRLYGMFTPDKSHIHHRLLAMGLSHRGTVLMLYLVSSFFAAGALIFINIHSSARGITLAIGLAILLILCIKKLRYYEIAIFNNGLMMTLYEKWRLNRTSLMGAADLVFITIAFFCSYLLLYNLGAEAIGTVRFGSMYIWLLPLQFAVLWMSGLYRERMKVLGIGNVLLVMASVVYAIGATGIALIYLDVLTPMAAVQFLIIDFYLLLSGVLGFRMAYQALHFWYNRDKPSGEHIVIYGTGETGYMMLHNIVNTRSSTAKIIGFLDDNTALEGKSINGYPILGGYWALGKTHKHKKIDTVYLCDENIKCENYSRLQATTQKLGITLIKPSIQLQRIELTDTATT